LNFQRRYGLFRRRRGFFTGGTPIAKPHLDMKCAEMIETETTVAPTASLVRFPAGLLGFEPIKDYRLVANPEEHPFLWLKAANDAGLAFVVVNPFMVAPDYRPDIPPADVAVLGLQSAEDAVLYAIVTLHGSGRATLNLKGPIVINRHTHAARQVILANAGDYSVQHALPLADAAA
jgi:flagellar assembly factor FliW